MLTSAVWFVEMAFLFLKKKRVENLFVVYNKNKTADLLGIVSTQVEHDVYKICHIFILFA